MQNVNKNAQKATVANVQATHPVINNAMRRLQARIAVVQQQRAAKNLARKQAANQQAYMLQVAQLAAQYGLPAPVLHNPAAMVLAAKQPRANSATVSPSNTLVYVDGVAYKPCKAVHALCAKYPSYTRAEMLQICKDNGINAATASTQVGLYRAAAAKAAAEAAAQ